MSIKKIVLLILLLLVSVACILAGTQTDTLPTRLGPSHSVAPEVILERLEIVYLGQDGHRVVGSGCPGNDGKGTIENFHFQVKGVDTNRGVQRVLVAGDYSTLTWEWPCSNAWGLVAEDAGKGNWDVFIAPSLPAKIYTIIFFYDDGTMALGMVEIP